MAYQRFGKIQVADYNDLLGATNSTTAETLNAIWGVGNGSTGYGQTAISQIPTSGVTKVLPAQWNSIINTMNAIKNHQGSTIVPITLNNQGNLIVARMTAATPPATPQSQFKANFVTLNSNRLNAAAQGATITAQTSRTTTWTNALTFTHTITFESGNKARYFFNAGGQIAINFSHPSGNFVNDLWNKLAIACGTIVISAQSTSNTINIAGSPYRGVERQITGGAAVANLPVATLATTRGYYGLTNSNVEIFKMLAYTGQQGYLSSFISVSARTNGAQLTNGDNGSIITITTVWDEIPNGGSTVKGTASANSRTTCTARLPADTYMVNTWGVPALAGSVTGS